jgi:3-deoxy-manno-octulosonate cytidylyltransferase (CMP-KDO synthetase)
VVKAAEVDRVLVATDSPRIRAAAEEFGAEVKMTSRGHRTGTDRVAEAVENIRADIVINVQGDTFGLKPAVLDRVISSMRADRSIGYATLARPITRDTDLYDPNTVKLAASADGRALWFSRLPIPYLQHPGPAARTSAFNYLGHIGVYFFRRRALREFADWPRSSCEKAESLEQLRILEHGRCIRVFSTKANIISIDTPADLKKIEKL